MRFSGFRRISAAALFFAACIFSPLLLCAEQTQHQPLADPGELVRKAVGNELGNLKTDRYFMWMHRTQKAKGSLTKQMIQTPEGIISRIVAINDKPLTPEQRKGDDSRIDRLLDPEKMRAKAKEQKDDEEHGTRMLRSLPEAFLYEYASTEITPQGHEIVKLNFSPNPKFNPPNHETQAFQGMKGEIWIDTHAMRLRKIDGTLFRDVNFGWGILGKLYKGGRFLVEQADVGNGHWDTTRMQLKFDGKIVMLKSLHIEETDTEWDFRPVPKVSVQQALTLLRKHDQLAQQEASSKAVQ